MKKETILIIITAIIAVLFFYASSSKLMDYDRSKWEMKNQIFPVAIAWLLTWLIPLIEIMLMFALLFPLTRIKALWASLFLLSSFTLYIGIVMTDIFGRVPCSCGGILKNMSYGVHLIFNLGFIALTLLGLATAYNLKINSLFNIIKKRKEPA